MNDSQLIWEAYEGDYLWHGSRNKFDGPIEPRRAKDLSGEPDQNLLAVYASEDRDLTIAIAMFPKDAEMFMNANEKPTKMVSVDGQIRHGEMVYLYQVSKDGFRMARDKDGKPVPSGNPEWVNENPNGVQPIKRFEIPVDDRPDLVRYPPTSEDMKFYCQYNPKSKYCQVK